MNRGSPASSPRHMHNLQGGPAVMSSRTRLANSLLQLPWPSSHPPSYSSPAAARTSCDPPRQHAIHTLPRSSTGTARTQSHIFLRQDAVGPALEPPCSVLHKVIARTDKTFKIIARGRQVTVSSLHRFWTGPGTSIPPIQPHSTPATTVTPPIRSHVPIPVFVPTPSLFSAARWCGNFPHVQKQPFPHNVTNHQPLVVLPTALTSSEC
jgi:hypothetical protein